MEHSQCKSASRQRSGNSVASFLIKTFYILESPEYEDIISWSPDNVSFTIKNVQAFSRYILPRYFRHSNFSSFVRQLNMYDFHKIKQDKFSIVFRNDLFTKNGLTSLKDIKRKAPKTNKVIYRDNYDVVAMGQPETNSQVGLRQRPYYKKTLYFQLGSSANLFDKTIKMFYRILPSKDLIQITLSNINYKPDDVHQLTESLYQLKKRVSTVLSGCIDITLATKRGLDLKFNEYMETGRDKVATDRQEEPVADIDEYQSQITSENQSKREESKSVQQQEPKNGFKPFSSHNLRNVPSHEETKISSTPLLNMQQA